MAEDNALAGSALSPTFAALGTLGFLLVAWCRSQQNSQGTKLGRYISACACDMSDYKADELVSHSSGVEGQLCAPACSRPHPEENKVVWA